MTDKWRDQAKALTKPPEREPNPVPNKMVADMTIAEQERMERWLGITPSTDERLRRMNVRAREKAERR